MKDINQVTLVGRLTRDAELKYTTGGTAIAKFSIANNYSKKVGDQWQELVNYFDCTVFGKTAEALNQYLVKGKQVAIAGELQQNRWQQDGQNRSKVEIRVHTLQLLGGKSGGSDAPVRQDSIDEGPFEDDIPF